MWKLHKQEQFQYELFQKIIGKCAAVYSINKADKSYERISADEELVTVNAEKGTLYDLYKTFFGSDRTGQSMLQNKYSMFADEELFFKDNYSGHLHLWVAGQEKDYDYRIFNMEEDRGIFILIPNEFWNEDVQYERRKMETIQENFLFSMIVDLKNDKCINSKTTELSTMDQNYLDMTYSGWLEMISNMFLPEDRHMFMNFSASENIIRHLEKQNQYKYELKMVNMQGEFIWVRLNFKRMSGFSRENPICAYTVQDIHEDMTRLLQQENIIAAIKTQNQQLSDLNKAQNVFISNMSHEIRTPINAVLGLDEMILREAEDARILDYAHDIKVAGKLLLNLINDILDYSKIEAGKIQIIPVEYHMETLISDINTMISPKAKEKELDYRIQVNPNLPRTLYGDEVRLKQILLNILTNAVKYTEKGEVLWTLDYEELDSQMIGLKVSVKDTGIGMKPEDLKNLASEFKRFDEVRNRNIEGTGLGMSIVTRLLKQMNSELEVESVYEEGSTFSFVLPQKVVDKTPVGELFGQKKTQPDRKEDEHVRIPKARILIVDDNRVNLVVIKGLLKRTEAQLTCALSGQECLDMLAENSYDLILLDHFMPEMDGIETLHAIRKMGLDYSAMPVIALTANVESDSREFYLNSGFNDFLEKPVIIDALEKVLREYLGELCE